MGFNNGYESGYEDAKAESARKIKALEARIAKLEAGGGASTPTVPMLKLDGSTVKGEIVWPGETAQYGGKFTTIQAVEYTQQDEETGEIISRELTAPTIAPGDVFIISTEYTGSAVPLSGQSWDVLPTLPGVYVLYAGASGYGIIAPLSALVL